MSPKYFILIEQNFTNWKLKHFIRQSLSLPCTFTDIPGPLMIIKMHYTISIVIRINGKQCLVSKASFLTVKKDYVKEEN